MGSVVKSIGGVVGGIFGAPKVKSVSAPNIGDVVKQGKLYGNLSDEQRAQLLQQQQAGQATDITRALSDRALGKGPSLAEAQLRSATNRNLAQQLAAASSMRGRNPAATQRQLLQQQGEAGRNLAQDAAVARMQEQQAAQTAALNQGNILAQSIGQNLQNSYGLKTGARLQQAQFQQDTNKINADIAAANQASQNQLTGALLGTGGTLLGSLYGKKGSYDGEKVPGQPVVDGDHPVNDMVPRMLSPGEIVIPRSHATSPEKAKRFVQQLLENMPKDIKPKKDIRDAIHAKYMKKKV